MERFEQQMNFILEVDKVKNIFRQTYLADGNRKENDAEHSWHLALMAFLLKEYANEEVDVAKVSIIGAGMLSNPGVAARMFEALYSANVNIKMIATSEIRITVLIDEADANRAVRTVHDAFEMGE